MALHRTGYADRAVGRQLFDTHPHAALGGGGAGLRAYDSLAAGSTAGGSAAAAAAAASAGPLTGAEALAAEAERRAEYKAYGVWACPVCFFKHDSAARFAPACTMCGSGNPYRCACPPSPLPSPRRLPPSCAQ